MQLMNGNIFRRPVEPVAARLLEDGDEGVLRGHNETKAIQTKGEVGDGTGRAPDHVPDVREVPGGVEADTAGLRPDQDRVDRLALLQVGEDEGRDTPTDGGLTHLSRDIYSSQGRASILSK